MQDLLSKHKTITGENTLDAEIQAYQKILNTAALISSKRVFTNSGKEHAAVAMSVMFANTRQKMQLIVDCFKGDVSNKKEYEDTLSESLCRGVSADILILQPEKLNTESKGFKLFKKYKELNPKQVQIKVATEQTKELLKNSNSISNKDGDEIYNIALFDTNKYRFEIVPSKFIALLSFNDTELVSKYQSIFSSAFNSAQTLA